MPKEQLVAPGLAPPNGHFSQATVAGPGRLVFVSGMTARRADGTLAGVGDITAQTHSPSWGCSSRRVPATRGTAPGKAVCRNLATAVEAAGGTLDDIARVDVYVRDIGDFAAVHAVRRQYFTGEPPASTMVEVSRFVHEEYLIEINAIAVLGSTG